MIDSNKTLKIQTHHIQNADPFSEDSKKSDKLCRILKKKRGNERTVILCDTDRSARRFTVALHSKRIKTCIVTREMMQECYEIAEKEIRSLENGDIRVGVFSVDGFELSDLPTMDHYVFVEFPMAIHRFGNLLDCIQRRASLENRTVRIDVITSNRDYKIHLNSLATEMKKRECVLPKWLLAFSTPDVPLNQFVKRRKFDGELQANSDGKYVIPAKCIIIDSDAELDDE